MIIFSNVSLQRGSQQLLDDASLRFHAGQKTGLVGANGVGKSSFFRLLLGQLKEDQGRVELPKHWAVAHMAQELAASQRSALDHVLDGDAELRVLQAKIDAASGETLAQLYEKFEAIHGYAAEARAQKLLDGLGFSASDCTRKVSELSGGWRIRLNLAQALMCRSDLLLLDEPTNHLDLYATVWLEKWLQRYDGSLIIVSHDRDFLDHVIDHVVHIDAKQLVAYRGNYSSFERQRAERLAQQTQAIAKQQQRKAEIEDFVRRFRAKASKAKQAQSRLKELQRMQDIAPAHIHSPFAFRFPKPEKLPQTLMSLSGVGIGYDTPLVKDISLSVLAGSRIGLLGHNGAGKSTLLKSLAGELSLLGGEKDLSSHLRIGYFSQHQLETLDADASPCLHIQRIATGKDANEQDIRSFLGVFGFHGDRVFECISNFSGGEKARLALALIAWQKPNLLLLDEPTNHLDIEARHALTVALQAYEGAIVLVSHDRHLLKSTVDQFLLVDAGACVEFDGDISDYEQRLLAPKSANIAPDSGQSQGAAQKVDKRAQRQSAAETRARLKPLTSKIKACEREMQQHQTALADIEERLSQSGLYQQENKDELTALLAEQGRYKNQLQSAEERWLALNEELEHGLND